MTLERDATGDADQLGPQVPPAGEQIHLPGPSLQPLMVAVGTTVALIGLTTSVLFVIAGVAILVVSISLWIRDTRRDIAELPGSHADH